jgi:hypothetical protein
MELELLPAVSLLPETLNVLVAPEEILDRALNGNPHLQQFRIVFPGIRSGVLARLDRSATDLNSEECLHLRPSCGPSWRRTTTPSWWWSTTPSSTRGPGTWLAALPKL